MFEIHINGIKTVVRALKTAFTIALMAYQANPHADIMVVSGITGEIILSMGDGELTVGNLYDDGTCTPNGDEYNTMQLIEISRLQARLSDI